MRQFARKILSTAVAAATTEMARRLPRGGWVAGAGLLMQSLVPTAAWAQGQQLAQANASSPAPATGTGTAAESSTPASQTVMVTARKKLERAQDVPVSMSAVSGESLVAKNRLSMIDYFAEVPGINLLGGDRGTSEISLRGLNSGTASRPTTAFTIDDTPFGGGQNIPDIDPSELQRVEVLRGPQGTLYGANSLGGLVKYVTVVPDTNRFSTRVQVDGSKMTHGTIGFGLRTAVNLPVKADVMGLRLSAYTGATRVSSTMCARAPPISTSRRPRVCAWRPC